MIVYRRYMNKIANEVARREGALAIVTGDSIGQVASQTLENLFCIREAADFPVFSPLIGMDKKDIIARARAIGTYDVSILPYDDCCSFMVAEHPAVRARLPEILEVERQVSFDAQDLLERAEIRDFAYP
jgi:thiamine biosynthesis protein ThiI